MRLESLTPMLQSSDMTRTIAWYRDMLGFECTGLVEGEWSCVERDGVKLMFMMNDHVGAPHATATQYFKVDDVDGLWRTLEQRIAAEWGPEDMSYGVREFAIKDPDGYLLSFGQDLCRSDLAALRDGAEGAHP